MKDGVASGAHAVITACLARIESILEPTLLYVVTVRVSCTRVVQDSDRQASEPFSTGAPSGSTVSQFSHGRHPVV